MSKIRITRILCGRSYEPIYLLIFFQNMSSNMAESTRAVKRAVKKLGDFDVICAKGDFAYTMKSNLFCQAHVDNLSCYVFSVEY